MGVGWARIAGGMDARGRVRDEGQIVQTKAAIGQIIWKLDREGAYVHARVPFCYHVRLCDHAAGVAELVDALGLGSSGLPVKVRVLSPAPVAQLLVLRGFGTQSNAEHVLEEER